MEIKTKFKIGEYVLVEMYSSEKGKIIPFKALIVEILITVKAKKTVISYRIIVEERKYHSTYLRVENKLIKLLNENENP